MKSSVIAHLALASLAAAAGTGPYSASWHQDPTAPNHVIYAPTSPTSPLRLPVLIWGQGGCSYDALTFDAFLKEVASQGVFILSNGTPNGPGNPNGVNETSYPNPALHKEGLDWATKYAGKGNFSHVDSSRVAVAGMSCGAIQAYSVQDDPRVTAIGIFNSGIKNPGTGPWEQEKLPEKIVKPIFYFLGGSTDIAYVNGERDYTRVPKGTPKWKGNLPVGHGGDYTKTNGGKFGQAASHWVQWVLRGNSSASAYFTGAGANTAKGTGWDVVYESLDGLKGASWD